MYTNNFEAKLYYGNLEFRLSTYNFYLDNIKSTAAFISDHSHYYNIYIEHNTFNALYLTYIVNSW